MLLDLRIPRDDEPALSRRLRDPVLVVSGSDRAGRSVPLVDDSARITSIGDIGPNASEKLAKSENVSVEVEPDLRRLHAAEVS